MSVVLSTMVTNAALKSLPILMCSPRKRHMFVQHICEYTTYVHMFDFPQPMSCPFNGHNLCWAIPHHVKFKDKKS